MASTPSLIVAMAAAASALLLLSISPRAPYPSPSLLHPSPSLSQTSSKSLFFSGRDVAGIKSFGTRRGVPMRINRMGGGQRCTSSAPSGRIELKVSSRVERAEFPPLKNDLIIRAAKGEDTERVPVWMHRQAGRYLPEFRNYSDRFPFMHRCSTPEIATRLTIQPVERYGLDAAIIFSDILVLLPPLGIEWGMVKGKGPVVSEPINTPEDLVRVRSADDIDVQQELDYVMEALTRSRVELDGSATLIGFSGAPWTLLGYMVQGEGAKSTQAVKAKGFLYKYPEASKGLLDNISNAVVKYLVEQVRSGAQMVQVFDSWAGELTPQLYEEFSIPYLKKIARDLKAELSRQNLPQVPVSVFPKGAASHALQHLADSEYDVISLDEFIDPRKARQIAPNKVLQGNLDPSILYLESEVIASETRKMIDVFGTQHYIANLGYAVDKSMDPELVGSFVREVQRYSAQKVADNKAETSTPSLQAA